MATIDPPRTVRIRTSTGWADLVIQGPKGDIGPQGQIGPQGPQGSVGPQGNTGTTGSQGPQGNPGTPGEKWFTGSGAPAGATGIVGDWYLDNSNGDYYEKTGASTWTLRGNLKGPQGATGNTGTTGSQGPQGNPGTPGEKWFTGSGAPAGTLVGSIVGDWYIDSANGDYYEKTAATTWTLRGNLRGPQGPTGATGSQGPIGNTGSQGPQGTTGATGSQGPAGPGVPAGGLTGTVLSKTTNGDYVTGWSSVDPLLPARLSGSTSVSGISGNNANNATQTGWYICATTTTNTPSATDALLEVMAHSANYVRQFWHNLYGSEVWTRINGGGGFGAWEKIYPVTDASLPIRLKPASPEPPSGDWNTTLQNGWYSSGSAINGPPGTYTYWIVQVSAWSDNTWAFQTAWELFGAKIWYREIAPAASGGPGTWQQIFPISDAQLPGRLKTFPPQVTPDTTYEAGFYCAPPGATGNPEASSWFAFIVMNVTGPHACRQFAMQYNGDAIYARFGGNGGWNPWKQIHPVKLPAGFTYAQLKGG